AWFGRLLILAPCRADRSWDAADLSDASTRKIPVERRTHLQDHIVPYAELLLSDESRRRVPRAVVTVEHPAPVRSALQEDPRRQPERTRKMSNGGIDSYSQVDARENRRGIVEAPQRLVEQSDVVALFEHSRLSIVQIALQNHEPHLIRIEERVELFDRHRAVGRVFVAAPRDADAPAL